MAVTHSILLAEASDQYLNHANATALEITGDCTIEFWAKPTDLDQLMFLICFGGGDETEANNVLYQIIFNTNGSLRWDHEYSTGSNETITTTATGVAIAAQWHHYAFVRDTTANTIAFYKDAESVETPSSYTNEATGGTTSLLTIGRNDGGSTTTDYDGRFCEFRLWNTARTESQIKKNWKREIDPSTSGLVGYWKFRNNANDATSNNLDLTENASPTYSSTDVPFRSINSVTIA